MYMEASIVSYLFVLSLNKCKNPGDVYFTSSWFRVHGLALVQMVCLFLQHNSIVFRNSKFIFSLPLKLSTIVESVLPFIDHMVLIDTCYTVTNSTCFQCLLSTFLVMRI